MDELCEWTDLHPARFMQGFVREEISHFIRIHVFVFSGYLGFQRTPAVNTLHCQMFLAYLVAHLASRTTVCLAPMDDILCVPGLFALSQVQLLTETTAIKSATVRHDHENMRRYRLDTRHDWMRAVDLEPRLKADMSLFAPRHKAGAQERHAPVPTGCAVPALV